MDSARRGPWLLPSVGGTFRSHPRPFRPGANRARPTMTAADIVGGRQPAGPGPARSVPRRGEPSMPGCGLARQWFESQAGGGPADGPVTVARAVAEWLAARGMERVYGLCGGHVLPIWDEVAQLGIRVVDVRHEGAAVHMAHAEAELTGRPGVALVTAGPGLTNAVTAIANAATARVPVVVVSGRVPRPQS